MTRPRLCAALLLCGLLAQTSLAFAQGALGGSIGGNEPGVNGESRPRRGRGGRGLRAPALRVRVEALGCQRPPFPAVSKPILTAGSGPAAAASTIFGVSLPQHCHGRVP